MLKEKISKNKKVLTILLISFFFSAIVLFTIFISTQNNVRKECPLKWVSIKDQDYFVYSDATLNRDEVDFKWIITSCEISKDIVY